MHSTKVIDNLNKRCEHRMRQNKLMRHELETWRLVPAFGLGQVLG